MNTEASPQSWRHTPTIYVAVVITWVIYVALGMFAPHVSPDKYHLGNTRTFLLQLTVYIPVLIIWILAARGGVLFKRYARMIQGSEEARGFSILATGLLWLLGYLVAVTLAGSIVPYAANSSWLSPAIVLKNHLPAYTAVVAFALLYVGALRLGRLTKRKIPARSLVLFWVIFLLFAGGCTWLFAHTSTEALMQRPGIPAYATPHTILLFSLVLPYLLAWALGLLASLHIHYYLRHVKGSIYRSALRRLVRGMGASVLLTMVLQLTVLSTPQLQRLNIGSVLLVLYGLILLYGLGSIYIASGAKKLSRIEMVR